VWAMRCYKTELCEDWQKTNKPSRNRVNKCLELYIVHCKHLLVLFSKSIPWFCEYLQETILTKYIACTRDGDRIPFNYSEISE
jgi:hypothetical protein